MFQKGCEDCIIFMDTASQAISAQLDAVAKLENAVSGGATVELLTEAQKSASQHVIDCKQALERVRIHQLAHESRAASRYVMLEHTGGWVAKMAH
jgi:hypothetical protein